MSGRGKLTMCYGCRGGFGAGAGGLSKVQMIAESVHRNLRVEDQDVLFCMPAPASAICYVGETAPHEFAITDCTTHAVEPWTLWHSLGQC